VTPIRLDQVNLIVRDVEVTRAFYGRLGLDFGEEHDPVWAHHHVGAPHGEHAAIDVDLDSTSFVQKWDAGWPGGTGIVVGFKVDSRQEVDELGSTLAAVLSDPDGNGVGIMSPIDPATRSEPPSPT